MLSLRQSCEENRRTIRVVDSTAKWLDIQPHPSEYMSAHQAASIFKLVAPEVAVVVVTGSTWCADSTEYEPVVAVR
ncbi:MAG: hypothetical protein AW08_03250 [Candidatus Accumulibacter adjunctus]|uniref:Uncharacterized protein n=1 Tax=Candidatus Accumulibacter adjunctus TaxID=1454001 RepID=A0A011MRW1_9PROT|nr:MAG: hypothetical protein AW08_03250 [Candidatus Accumulibacter adjunctus]